MSSHQLEEAIFEFTIKEGFQTKEKISELYNNEDFRNFIISNQGKSMVASLRVKSSFSEKELLYNYYYGPVLAVVIRILEKLGWEAMNKYKADLLMKKMFLCDKIVNNSTGETEIIPEEKKKITKLRFHKFVYDVLMWLEIEHGETPPDAAEWKAKILTGTEMKKVSKIKPSNDF